MKTETFRPRTLAQYGQASHRTVAENYVRNPDMADALLLHGPPGTGKTTLVRCLAHDTDADLVDVNASMDLRKQDLAAVTNAAVSDPIGHARRIVFIDEADHLRASQQKRLKDLIELSRHPVILACNDAGALSKAMKSLCLDVEVSLPSQADKERVADRLPHAVSPDIVSRARTYRDLLSALQGGDVSGPVQDLSDIERMRAWCRGEDVDLKTSDYHWLAVWVMDHDTSARGALVDKWWTRYREVGKPMEKYVLRAAEIEADARWPWSMNVQGKDVEPESEVEKEGVETWI